MLKSSPIILSSNSKNNHYYSFFIPIKYLIFPHYSCGRWLGYYKSLDLWHYWMLYQWYLLQYCNIIFCCHLLQSLKNDLMQFTISMGIIVFYSHKHPIILKLCQQVSNNSSSHKITHLLFSKLFWHNRLKPTHHPVDSSASFRSPSSQFNSQFS